MHIQSVTNLNIHLPPGFSPDAMAALEKRMGNLGRTPAPTPLEQTPAGRPAIGGYWPGHGGFYAGDMRGDDGVVYGLIVADCGEALDAGRAKWGPEGELDLSQWDGLANTRTLGNEHPAAKLAAGHTTDEHQDFYLPARRELQLAAANVPHLFGAADWYWSSTPRTESFAWAVDFELGTTFINDRYYEFRVRPVRRFIY